jgi:hypothetical protein
MLAAFSSLGRRVKLEVLAKLADCDLVECRQVLEEVSGQESIAVFEEEGRVFWWHARDFVEQCYPGEKRAHLYAEAVDLLRQKKPDGWEDLINRVVLAVRILGMTEVLENERFKKALYGIA